MSRDAATKPQQSAEFRSVRNADAGPWSHASLSMAFHGRVQVIDSGVGHADG